MIYLRHLLPVFAPNVRVSLHEGLIPSLSRDDKVSFSHQNCQVFSNLDSLILAFWFKLWPYLPLSLFQIPEESCCLSSHTSHRGIVLQLTVKVAWSY